MRHGIKTALAAFVVELALAGSTIAGPIDDGLAAYNRRDYATAMRLWRPLAEKGEAAAQDYLGFFYETGQGVPHDDAEAAKWFRRAADQGLAAAQNKLGFLYENGQGVPQDYAEAAKWFRRAAEQGLPNAMVLLGSDYELGHGVPQDYVLAHMWYNLLASQKDEFWQLFGASKRQKIADKMTRAEIAEAERFARQCQQQKFKNCGQPATSGARVASAVRSAPKSPSTPFPGSSTQKIIPLESDGGTFRVPVVINGVLTLRFVIDSGASDVSIPSDVFATLRRTGTISDKDFLGSRTYVLADGSNIPSQVFRIRSLKVGDMELLNVTGSVAPAKASLLLGQSFLSRLKSWSIDNTRRALIID